MGGAAFDISNLEPVKEAPAVASTPSVDLSNLEPVKAEAPSLIQRTANAVNWTKKALSGVTDLSKDAISGAVNDVKNLGNVEVPGPGPGGKITVPAFNLFGREGDKDPLARMGAVNTAVNLTTLPMAAEYIGGEGAITGAGMLKQGAKLVSGVVGSNYVTQKFDHAMENAFPSQTMHARLLKWLADQGVSGATFAAFLGMPGVIGRFGLGGALHEPPLDLVPEDEWKAGETPQEPSGQKGPTSVEGEPGKPAEPAAEPSKGGLAALTPKPEREPQMIAPPEGPPIELTPEQEAPAEPHPLGEFQRLQRHEPPDVTPDLNKPQGLYLSPSSIESPHAEPGYKRFDYEGTARNPLDVSDVEKTPIRQMADDSGAGVKALRKLNPELFDDLKKLRLPELRQRASQLLPGVDVNKYYDKQEILEAIGGQTARSQGHDALIHRDPNAPEFSEYVALHPDAVRSTEPPVSEEAQQAAHEQLKGEVTSQLSQYPGGKVWRVPTEDIHTDPDRFQYKLHTNEEGAGVSLTGSQKFDPNLAETSLLWRDPEDRKLYVVNGHNRLALAKQSGEAGHPWLPSQIVDGGNSDPDAIGHNFSVEDARALGAQQNIGAGKGTAVDAAKFFRDQRATAGDLATIGMDMNSALVRDALALKKLDSNIFHFVTVGELTQNQGVILGEELGDHPRGQEAAFRWLKDKEQAGKEVTNGVLREVASDIRDAGETSGESEQAGLFGGDLMKRSLFEERGTIMAAVKNRISSERAAFGNAARNKAKLEGVGNVLTDENAMLADRAGQRLGILDAKKSGPINEALNNAARELAENPKRKNAIIDQAYKAISQAADDTLRDLPAKTDEQPSMFGAPQPARAPAEPGFTLGASIPGGPQIAAALEPEIKYWGDSIAEGGSSLLRKIRATFAPQMLGPMAGRAKEIIVEARGEQAARAVPNEIAALPLRVELERIPETEWRRRYEQFYGPYERGETPAGIPERLRPLLGRMREATDQRWHLINRLRERRGKQPMAYLDNYLAHLYADDPEKVRETLTQMGRTSGKQLNQGTPFLNSRTYLNITDAMRAGLTPRYKNPIDMYLAGLRQQDAYIAAQSMFNNMHDAGLLRFFRTGQHEEGWTQIPDDFFDVKRYSPEAGGVIQQGEWRAPKEVVQVLKNHLSPSIAADDSNIAGEILKHVGPGSGLARFNAFRVGFSTFHFLNENNAAYAQLQGAGIARALTGLMSLDAKEMLNGTRAFTEGVNPGSVNELFTNGSKIMRALVEPGSEGAEYDRAVQAAITGGMRFKPEEIGTLSDVMQRAMSEVVHPLARAAMEGREKPPITRAVSRAIRVPSDVANATSAALMRYYVPRVKMGAYYKLLGQEMDHYVGRMGGEIPWAMQRKIMQDVASHVDSVFGQMVEDNLFMSRTMKDILHLGVAYPGWNIGSLRIAWKALGGVGRIARFQQMDTQQRLAVQFTMGLATSQAIQNALLMRVLAGTWPRTLQDLYQPQDGTKDAYGNPGRIAPPSYTRTYIGMVNHPVGWAQNIMDPYVGFVDDVVNNRERYTGRQLVDPTAPLQEQVLQAGEYLGRFAAPFSYTNYERLGQMDATPLRKSLGAIGYSPVPAQYLRTEAENYVINKEAEQAPRTGLTERQYAAKQSEIALENALRDKTPLSDSQKKSLGELEPALRQKVESDALKNSQLPKIVNMMRRMQLHDVLDTYEIAQRNGDVRNQKYAEAIIEDKASRMDPEKWEEEMEKLDPATRERYTQLLMGIIAPSAPKVPASTEAPLS